MQIKKNIFVVLLLLSMVGTLGAMVPEIINLFRIDVVRSCGNSSLIYERPFIYQGTKTVNEIISMIRTQSKIAPDTKVSLMLNDQYLDGPRLLDEYQLGPSSHILCLIYAEPNNDIFCCLNLKIVSKYGNPNLSYYIQFLCDPTETVDEVISRIRLQLNLELDTNIELKLDDELLHGDKQISEYPINTASELMCQISTLPPQDGYSCSVNMFILYKFHEKIYVSFPYNKTETVNDIISRVRTWLKLAPNTSVELSSYGKILKGSRHVSEYDTIMDIFCLINI